MLDGRAHGMHQWLRRFSKVVTGKWFVCWVCSKINFTHVFVLVLLLAVFHLWIQPKKLNYEGTIFLDKLRGSECSLLKAMFARLCEFIRRLLSLMVDGWNICSGSAVGCFPSRTQPRKLNYEGTMTCWFEYQDAWIKGRAQWLSSREGRSDGF